MTMTAFPSCLMISRVASMPLLNGITMSMVVRSGWSSLYFSTARAVGRLASTFEPAPGEDVLDHVAHEDRVVHDEDFLRHGARLLRARSYHRCDGPHNFTYPRWTTPPYLPPNRLAASAASASGARSVTAPTRAAATPRTIPEPGSTGGSGSTPSTRPRAARGRACPGRAGGRDPSPPPAAGAAPHQRGEVHHRHQPAPAGSSRRGRPSEARRHAAKGPRHHHLRTASSGSAYRSVATGTARGGRLRVPRRPRRRSRCRAPRSASPRPS